MAKPYHAKVLTLFPRIMAEDNGTYKDLFRPDAERILWVDVGGSGCGRVVISRYRTVDAPPSSSAHAKAMDAAAAEAALIEAEHCDLVLAEVAVAAVVSARALCYWKLPRARVRIAPSGLGPGLARRR